MNRSLSIAALLASTLVTPVGSAQDLVAHWPLTRDARDVGPLGWHAAARGGVRFEAVDDQSSAAHFDGRDGLIEAPAHPELEWGTSDFTVAATICLDERGDDQPGDVLSCYDPQRRRGWHVTVKTNTGAVLCQANARQLQFGIDDGRDSDWQDCGRPGGERSILPFALVVHRGQLFAATCQPQANDAGHVYRYVGEQKWVDCGAPANCNAVSTLISFDGDLYAGSAKYRTAGSSLAESENTNPGGRIYRYVNEGQWVDCGGLPGSNAVGCMAAFRGKLYATSLYAPAGFYCYEGGQQWTDCGSPFDKRVESLAVFNGALYAASYDLGNVYRYDGQTWTDYGRVGENTQCYGFATYRGRLHVSTWPSGRVFRLEDSGQWVDTGRLGEELETMGLVVHNGRLLGGTLPSAEVHQYDGDGQWKKLARLDSTPDVKYRRAWTAAEYQGRTYWGVLPSGRVWSFAAGRSVTWDEEFPIGWHQIAAVRRASRLELWVDGRQVALSDEFSPHDFDLSTSQTLRIGSGATDFFYGRMRDVKIFRRALSVSELQQANPTTGTR